MKLSRKRAEAVKAFLVSAGIDESRIGTVGYGPDKPIADNETKEGKEKNRRIEFRLLGTEEKVQTQPEPEDINPSPDRESKGKAGGKDGRTARRPRKERAPLAKVPVRAARSRSRRQRGRARRPRRRPPEGNPMPAAKPAGKGAAKEKAPPADKPEDRRQARRQGKGRARRQARAG